MTDFPTTKYQRGKIFAKTGLKVGKNYASHFLKSWIKGENDRSALYKKSAEDLFGEFTKLRGTALKIAQFSFNNGSDQRAINRRDFILSLSHYFRKFIR